MTVYCKVGPDIATDNELVWGSHKGDTTSYNLQLSCTISTTNESSTVKKTKQQAPTAKQWNSDSQFDNMDDDLLSGDQALPTMNQTSLLSKKGSVEIPKKNYHQNSPSFGQQDNFNFP